MKNWKEKPRIEEVEETIKEFFDLLSNGKLNEAKDLINHRHDDWESQIWSLWQDTHLIFLEELDQEVEDESFAGNLWKTDTSWLQKISVDEEMSWDEDSVFVNVMYENELTDVSADFTLEKEGEGYCLTREIIRIA